ncbi:MAG: hypothetical protein OXN97_24240 [Bryobacterales bacterium]|nr:hypothetical protein [Bryobacterales bacterium]
MPARPLAISRGEHKPAEREPTVGLTSVGSFAKAPSLRGRELSALIAEEHPASLAAGRSNPSRTLKTMLRHGPAERERGRRGTLALRVPHSQGG